MNDDAMLGTVVNVVRLFVGEKSNLNADTRLLETGMLDSINVVQIITILEERLGSSVVKSLSFEHFESCRTLAAALTQRRAA